MSTAPKLPPSARDFLIFERLVVENATTRTVATEIGLSQTRVRQIAHRVTHWLAETLPTAEADLSEAVQLRLGQHIAADRLERFYLIAIRSFEETAQAKYANLCIRILAAQTKLPVITGTLQALAADAIEGPLPNDTSSLYATCRPNSEPVPSTLHLGPRTLDRAPPVRACSPSPAFTPPATHNQTAPPATTSVAEMSCDNLPSAIDSARRRFLAPAHSPANDDRGSVLELKITPENLGFTSNDKQISRKERRRMRRHAMSK